MGKRGGGDLSFPICIRMVTAVSMRVDNSGGKLKQKQQQNKKFPPQWPENKQTDTHNPSEALRSFLYLHSTLVLRGICLPSV